MSFLYETSLWSLALPNLWRFGNVASSVVVAPTSLRDVTARRGWWRMRHSKRRARWAPEAVSLMPSLYRQKVVGSPAADDAAPGDGVGNAALGLTMGPW